jgi:predicted XRE-type DNA-binding protein
MDDEPLEYVIGSDNIFADTGVPNPEEALARAELMRRVTHILRERRLTQAAAAKLLGTNQPTVSDLLRGKMSKFSLERLIRFLNALGEDVEISVRRRARGSRRVGKTLVSGD